MSELADRVDRIAMAHQRRSGVDRRYRLAECRSLEQRRDMFARLQRDDPQFVEPLRLFAEVFGRGAVAKIDVIDGGAGFDFVGVVPLPVVDVVRVDGARCCYWASGNGSGYGRGQGAGDVC